jgi:TatD DNase family protein
MLVDSHCHLNMCNDSHEGLVRRAKEAGVSYLQTICTELSQIPDLLKIAEAAEGIFVSVGVHPCSVQGLEQVPSFDTLVNIAMHPKIISLGETGLDYYHPNYNKQYQQQAFVNHINVSQQNTLPVIVHTRDADRDTAECLISEYKNQPFKGLIHCFGSDLAFAKRVLDIGFYISISGIVTFKNAQMLQDVVSYVPLDRLLVETDSPYLAPVPMRGRENEPSFVKFVAEKIAQIKSISLDEVANTTTDNFFNLFSKATR